MVWRLLGDQHVAPSSVQTTLALATQVLVQAVRGCVRRGFGSKERLDGHRTALSRGFSGLPKRDACG